MGGWGVWGVGGFGGLGGWGVGGLERGEAETGSVNKPAVKFCLEIEPLGHSGAMGEGRGGGKF